MKRLILILATIGLWTTLPAQSSPQLIDGTVWKRMKYENKYYFLIGYFAGLQKSLEIIDIAVENQKRQEFGYTEPFYVNQMRRKISAYLPAGNLTEIEALVETLNLFYTDKYNQAIPIEVALRIVLARAQGNSEQADFWLKEARRTKLQKP